MKKILKICLSIVGILYFALIVFVTGCLLFYNQYKVTQINDKTFIIIDDKSDKYTDGDLVIFTKNPNDEIVSGDEIFFYEVTKGKVNVVSGEVTKSEKITDTETTFTINGNHEVSSENVIGKVATASVYPTAGKVLYVFESRFGFLLLVILPALLFFFYEIYRLVVEIKKPKEDATSEVAAPVMPEVKPEPVAAPVTPAATPEPVAAPVTPEVKPEPVVAPVTPEVKPEPVAAPVTPAATPEPVAAPVMPEVKPEPVAAAPEVQEVKPEPIPSMPEVKPEPIPSAPEVEPALETLDSAAPTASEPATDGVKSENNEIK